jgi:hypothetical protein
MGLFLNGGNIKKGEIGMPNFIERFLIWSLVLSTWLGVVGLILIFSTKNISPVSSISMVNTCTIDIDMEKATFMAKNCTTKINKEE